MPALLLAADQPWPWAKTNGSETANKDVTLLLLGDINIQHRADPASAFANVHATLNHADLVYGNLEGLLIKSEGPARDIPDKSGWQHIGPEAVTALKAGNIRVVGVANNVAYGPENIMKSLAVLDAAHIAHTGAGANLDAAHAPAIVTVKGVKIGFLQYTAKWYAQDHQIATANRAGVARILSKDGAALDDGDLARLREDIRRLRPQVDVIIVSSHNRDGAGRPLPEDILAETRPIAAPPADNDPSLTAPIPLGPRFSQAEEYEKVLAHAAVDAGADIVYGHGSHVMQGVEIYKGKPVMWCLGNFATDWIRMQPNKEGLVARVVIHNKHIARVSLVPVTRDDATNNVTMLDPAGGAGAALMQKVQSLSADVPLRLAGHEVVLIQRESKP